MQARSYIHSTLSLEYGSANEPSEPQLAFHRLQVKVAKKKEAFRATIAKISTLQILLDTERQGYTSSPSLERELVHLRHSYSKLSKIARDLGFDAARLLHTYSSNDHRLWGAMQGSGRPFGPCLTFWSLFCFFSFLHISYVVSIPPCMERSIVNC